nr:hypothetical protein [Erwinia rhapontici]
MTTNRKVYETLKGPSLHLAQFSDDIYPFNTLDNLANWAQEKGFKALQIPAWDSRLFDVNTAAQSQTYSDDLRDAWPNAV